MIRLGLCCKFNREPITFKTVTATALARLPRGRQLDKLSGLAAHNAAALLKSMTFCAANGIGSFRVNSQILPVKTHPSVGYRMADLPDADRIVAAFKRCGAFARQRGLRVTFHPDQFILLSAADPEITRKSVADLLYQAEVAQWIGADVLNIHAGGAYGDKTAALQRLAAALRTLPARVRSRLTLENDDRLYTPAELLPFCRKHGVPFVYDVHHHRCLPDGLTVEAATRQTLATWDREPLMHLSSPKDGFGAKNPRPHHDHIALSDFPDVWRGLDTTIEVEAKAKEDAVASLRQSLVKQGVALWHCP